MALKKITQEELNEIINNHTLWLESKGSFGKRANFTKLDLSGLEFHGRNLTNAVFISACLDRANLSGVDLTHAQMRDVSLYHANLSETVLNCTNMLRANLYGALIHKALIKNISFLGVIFTKADFHQALIYETEFMDCNLDYVNLSKCGWWCVDFIRSSMIGANLSDAHDYWFVRKERKQDLGASITFDRVKLEKARFIRAHLSDARFQKVNATQINFSLAYLEVSDFIDTKLYWGNFNKSKIEYVDLENVEFYQNKLSDINFLDEESKANWLEQPNK